jgi:hypothetical protein
MHNRKRPSELSCSFYFSEAIYTCGTLVVFTENAAKMITTGIRDDNAGRIEGSISADIQPESKQMPDDQRHSPIFYSCECM